jgi:hypothetical protein
MRSVTHDGTPYFWENARWVDRDGITPPLELRQWLNKQLAPQLADEDASITDPDELVDKAQGAVMAGQMDRAVNLAVRAWRCDRRSEGRAAFLIATLRKVHRAEDGLKVLKHIPKLTYIPLMVTTAAALCDVERWEEGHRMISRALAASRGKPGGETFAVYQRIKAARPDLCT